VQHVTLEGLSVMNGPNPGSFDESSIS
jgi:hypothetical protein